MHLVKKRFPIGWDRFHERKQIRDAHIIDCCRVEIGRVGNSRQRGVTAVTPAVNRKALRVGNALFDQPLDTVSDVVLHRFTPLLE